MKFTHLFDTKTTSTPAVDPRIPSTITYSAAPSFDLIPSLDGFRALSIAFVVASHFGLGWIVPGGFGVTVFFFISGFLITRQLLAELGRTGHIKLGAFYVRRLLRLYPALIAMVLIGGGAFAALGGTVTKAQTIAALSYLYNYGNFYYDWNGDPALRFGPYNVLWSLAVEEHYYLVFPLLLLVFGRSSRTFTCVLGGAILAVVVWRWHVADACQSKELLCLGARTEDRIESSTDTRLDSIFYGALLATILGSRWSQSVLRALRSPWLFFLAALLLVGSLVIREPTFRQTFRYSVQGLGLFFAIGSVLFSPWMANARSALSSPPARLLGRLSYSLYLWHWIVLTCALQIRFGHVNPTLPEQSHWLLLMAVPLIAASLIGACGSYYGIERRLLRLRRRWGSHSVADVEPVPRPVTYA